MWWEDDPIKKFVLYEKSFGWMDVWGLIPEGLGSLWLMASMIGCRRVVPLPNYNLVSAFQVRKNT
jgi:hypothetical protein